ncbi:class I SAM-dependent methyltransferase [Nocardia sp. NPDC051052]|uniref:class I SAM-dependent methyltransferase n=1 Tax=Nocardia sp. NPDC051052 TaxID=3364322 RepID=UPI0037B17876
MEGNGWEWDSSLYRGSAAYYARGRLPYPTALAEALTVELRLDGSGRLLDVGCGPGSLTLLLAGGFEQAIGIDADADMIREAGRLAAQAAIPNTRWVCMRAEDLPAGLGRFELITFAQSFHWMERPKVAAAVHHMLEPGGVCAHVHAKTYQGIAGTIATPYPKPPHAAIEKLVHAYLGPVRRAGASLLPNGTASGEDAIYQAAGFTRQRRIDVRGSVVTRTTDDVVAVVFSLSSSTPHLFGETLASFETELRQLLHNASPNGMFSEHTHEIGIDIWQRQSG